MTDATGRQAETTPREQIGGRGGEPAGAWMRHGLLSIPRGLIVAALSQTACIALFIAATLAIAFIGLGVGLLVAPAAVLAVRGLTNLHRQFARDWSGVEIPVPYRPQPRPESSGLIATLRRCRWMLTDPATWRDMLWMLVNAPLGLLLGLLPGCLIAYGLEGIVVAPFLLPSLGDSYGYGLSWFAMSESWTWAALSVPQGALILLIGLTAGPQILKGHALFTQSLLAPTRQELARRVRRLTETRSDAIDTQAAELRRIERDLHDGAQARLVALGMSIGLAETLIAKNPEGAQKLLAEAREASGLALSELRDLVRGIHPPVLAERGLDGAVRAVALTFPLPVDVHVDLPARPQAPVESAVYFAIVETLTNVAKHSGAGRAWVQLQHSRGRLVAIVGDDGIGGADPANGSGLRGLERRLAAFDGTIAVTSPTGGPTIVTMELPCELSSPKISPSSGTD